MKRTPPKTAKRLSRSSAPKQQSTLLSFFSPKADREGPSMSNTTPKNTPSEPEKLKPLFSNDTPSTGLGVSSRPRSSRSRTYAEKRLNQKSPDQHASALKRELFLDADDEEQLLSTKRARIHDEWDHGHRSSDTSPFSSARTGARENKIATPSRNHNRSFSQFESSDAKSSIRATSVGDSISRYYSNCSHTAAKEPSGKTKSFSQAQLLSPEPGEAPAGSNPVDVDKPDNENHLEGGVDLLSMSCPGRSTARSLDLTPRPLTEERRKAREKLAAHAANVRGVGDEVGGWCERHPWSVQICDARKRPPEHPDYDKSTLYVPPSELSDNRGTKNGGLSPFQRQFWSIKKDHYDVLIFFKKGKFYELYDVDADIGHKELGLNYTKGGRVDMRCCGVPEQAFDKHTARLIDLGYKVGRVEQTETAIAAEKRKNASKGNKSSICERSLVRVLTKATVSDDGLLKDHRSRYVIAILEDGLESFPSVPTATESGSDNSTVIGICYVDVASGRISISQILDDARLCKTERLLTFLQPHEYIIDTSTCSERLRNIVRWDTRRHEADLFDLAKKNGFQIMTESRLASYLLDPSSTSQHREEYERVCQYIKQYPLGSKAFGAMASYLKTLVIDRETLSIGNYNLFPSPDTMETESPAAAERFFPASAPDRLLMDASTLQNLEVLSSSLDGSERGALLSFIDRAQTAAGRRLLRKWISEPLVSAEEIEDRLQAVSDIHVLEDEDGGRTLNQLLKQLRTKKDLERALPRLHRQATTTNNAVMFDDTNKRNVKSFVSVLRSLQDCLCALETLARAMDSSNPKSKRLKWLCAVGGGIPADVLDKLNYFLGEAFDLEKAESLGEIAPKAGAIPNYDTCREALDEIEYELSLELRKWQTKLRDKTVKFYHRGKEPYQLEVRLSTIRNCTPDAFEVVSESKTAKRFYTRAIKSLVRQQKDALESFEAAASSVARDIMRQFDQEYKTWDALSKVCAEVDAIIGLAFASRDEGSGPMTRPTILPNEHPHPTVHAKGLRHPILARLSESFVSNDVRLGGEGNPDIMILTGPNAGGKSTLARQIAVSAILAQTGCFVPAQFFALRPFEDIYVRMGASDDLARGRSTFMVEMEEVSNILNNATSRSLVIADEVGRGTSTHDGYAVAYASLDHMAKVNRSLVVFSTHYSQLGEDVVAQGCQGGRSPFKIYEMAAAVNEQTKNITFLYKLQEGSGGQSRGVYCARVAGISGDIADEAEEAAQRFDRSLARRLSASQFSKLHRGLDNGPGSVVRILEHL
ncbi:DNA mismatch repair protein msh6 [Gracilariopsis chorda]|uniref:DNA mismatch repair protein n=1 Tax=Gracilariopsis chorda TaxID=448386 RepID=A0A2V3IJS1_9FLOR|nr:DNA mismatch repair protein msh6 [Gracilariopsis chorda]|eukprot:PXF42345.1 DNA mismatch repair protein msh6 [Gracilariopsis chorda]